MYNIGFTTVTFRKKSVEEIIDIAKKAAINCIEWGGDVHVPPDNEENAKRVRALCDAAGIKSVSYGSYYRVGFNDMAAFERVCKTADILGARIVRVWLGLKASAETSEEEFLALCDEVSRMADIAQKYSVTIGFEFHHVTFNDCGENTVRLINKVNIPNVKTYWQPFSDGTDDKNLSKVLDYVVTVHVFNWDDKGQRFLMSEGTEKWRKFVSRIKAAHDDCNFILEFVKDDEDDNFIKDIDCIKQLVE